MKKYIIRVNGKAYDVEVEEVSGAGSAEPAPPPPANPANRTARKAPVAKEPASVAETNGESDSRVTSPMAGTIVKILVEPGDSVDQGDVLLVLEAMKMENDVMASVGGKIKSIQTKVGDIVNAGDLLITLE